MEVKINIECVIKILEKHGYEIDERKDAEVGSPITANKEIALKDSEKLELFQVVCGAPYVKFEAKIDNDMQQGMLNALNQGLNSLVKGAQAQTVKKVK
jgi:hypothetical protein